MLIGMDHVKDAPKEQSRQEGIMLYKSEFGIGYIACSNMSEVERHKKFVGTEPRVLNCRSTFFHPSEFIPAEAMGKELPRRCSACRNCKECQFRMDSLSFKENTEYEIILSKLKLDLDWKKWVAGYPFNMLVWGLIDNYSQAKGYMGKMESRLVKMGRLDEFNRQFQDNMDRKVFWQLTKNEAASYKGPINYISMMEAFKAGQYATTPQRIFMNSSMNQPPPSGVSLNDYLIKGPSALADLYTL
jgi:hypothetical protein